jgi:hypothetical protein
MQALGFSGGEPCSRSRSDRRRTWSRSSRSFAELSSSVWYAAVICDGTLAAWTELMKLRRRTAAELPLPGFEMTSFITLTSVVLKEALICAAVAALRVARRPWAVG